ncbi:hypothetical protein ACTA71_007876 [Dictyostelium dimigraforme]
MKIRILLFFLLVSIILNVSFSLDKTKNIENNPDVELTPDIGESKNNNNLELNKDEKQNNENVEVSNVGEEYEVEYEPDNEYEFRQVSFEENLKKIINDIVSISKRNREQDITSLLNYIFNIKPKAEDFEEYNQKQSKFQQIVDYIQSFDEIIKNHQYQIDKEKVRQFAHEYTKAYSKVFELNDEESVQFEDNLNNLATASIRKFLSSFGLTEFNYVFQIPNKLERDIHRDREHPEVSYFSLQNVEKISKVSSLTESNIQDISREIVALSERDSSVFFKKVMEKLEIDNSPTNQKVANIASIFKTALRIMYSMVSKFQSYVNDVDNSPSSLNAVAKYPSWINEEYIQDVDKVVNTDELFNPRTIVAFNKLFIRDNEPISKYDQETLTHQFVDLAYSILYGRQQKYEEFVEKGKSVSETNIDPLVINRIISMADDVQNVSEQESTQGNLLRAARVFFNLFHIRENYHAYNEAEQEQENNQLNNENTQQQQQQQQNQEQDQEQNNENIENNNQPQKQQKQASSNIQYIAHRVNKLIQENPKIEQGDEVKRNENVFRILYNIYLHYYGLEDQNQLESNNKVSNKRIEKENPEVSFIREIIPSLSEHDVVDILEEIDRVADQLGYKSRKVEEIDENDQQINNGETRDLGEFEYPENDDEFDY